MKAIATQGAVPEIYRSALERMNKGFQQEISKRLVLSSCLVLSDLFGFDGEQCNKFKRGLEEILHGYDEELYRCRDNVGKMEDLRIAMEAELAARGVELEDWQ